MRVTTASVTVSPVISPSAVIAPSASITTASGVIPDCAAYSAASQRSAARASAAACLALVMSAPSNAPSPRPTVRGIRLSSLSSPSPVFAESGTMCRKCFFSSFSSSCCGRSTLFTTAIARWPAERASTSISSSLMGLEPSNTARMSEEAEASAIARSMPACSTGSSVLRRPAVSVTRSRICPTLTFSSMRSRVVPGISVTIARSRPSSVFSSVDLPAFGLPRITHGTPSLRIRPRS